jgi:hypothetical protein
VLLGRENERQGIAAALTAARRGDSAVLLVVGEPGIGKTALLDDAARAAGDMRLLRARGVESEAHIPFAGLLELLRPVLDRLDPFLANLNPVIRYLGYFKTEITNFITAPPAGISGVLACPLTDAKCKHLPAPRHALRQLSYTSQESLSIQPKRLDTNRGNGYLQPHALNNFSAAKHGIFPNFDCKPSGGEVNNQPPKQNFANCFVAPNFPNKFGGGQAPDLFADP